MKNNKGQNLVEFIIVASLIGLAALVVLTILGKNVTDLFTGSKDKFAKFKPFDSESIGDPSKSQGPVTLPSGAVVTNNPDGTFNLNLDNITLTNLPKNYSTLVQTTGSSAGTDSIVSIIDQIKSQVEVAGDATPAELQLLMDMSTKARNMAAVELQLENYAKIINQHCFEQGCAMPDPSTGYDDADFKNLIATLAGEGEKKGNGGQVFDMIKLAEQLNSSKFATKNPQSAVLVNTLQSEIIRLARQIEINNRSMHAPGEGKLNIWNSVDITNPGSQDGSSTITDLDGTIICQVGNGSYNAEGCK